MSQDCPQTRTVAVIAELAQLEKLFENFNRRNVVIFKKDRITAVYSKLRKYGITQNGVNRISIPNDIKKGHRNMTPPRNKVKSLYFEKKRDQNTQKVKRNNFFNQTFVCLLQKEVYLTRFPIV